jgi:hypothetical protein
MAITISDVTLRNTIVDAIITRLNAGTTDANADLVFQTSGGSTTLSTHAFADPPAGSASSGAVTFSAIGDATAAATGTAAQFIARNKDNTTIFSGTVTATSGGGDIEFNTVSWTSGGTVQISSLTLTVPGA